MWNVTLRQISQKCALFSVVVAALTAAATGCTLTSPDKNQLKTSNLREMQNQSDSIYRVYKISATDSKDVSLVGSVLKNGKAFEWSSAVAADLAARDARAAKAVTYVLTAYSPGKGKDGDFYYQTPIFSNSIDLNGAATALWLLIRYSMIDLSKPTLLSNKTWENLLFVLESNCSDCTSLPAEKVYNRILNSPVLIKLINAQLQLDQPAASLSSATLGNPPAFTAISDPPSLNGTGTAIAMKESESRGFFTRIYDLRKSTQPILPESWTHVDQTGAETTAVSETDRYQFTAADTSIGDHSIRASKVLTDGRTVDITFPVRVNHVNHPPVVPPIAIQTFISNHKKKIDLTAIANATDPDPQSEIAFNLVSYPENMALQQDTITGHWIIEWMPNEIPYGDGADQLGEHTVSLTADDGTDRTGFSFKVNVLKDQLPTFDPAMATAFSFAEGTGAITPMTITTTDADGDKILVTCASGCTSLKRLFPATAVGWPAAPTYTGLPGNQTVQFDWIPSYLETIGGNAARTITLKLDYDTRDGNLRSVVKAAIVSVPITLTVLNRDDPPTWVTQPPALAGPVTEGALMPNIFGVAADPFVAPATAVGIDYSLEFDTEGDPNINLSTSDVDNCKWLKVDSTAHITGSAPTFRPPYYTQPYCKVRIVATDKNLLATNSNWIVYSFTDVNQPITNGGPAIPTLTAIEGQQFTLNLARYFPDPDRPDLTGAAGIPDPLETVATKTGTMHCECVNCQAKGVWGLIAPAQAGNGKVSDQPTCDGMTFKWTPNYMIVNTGAGGAPQPVPTTFSGLILRVWDKGYPADPYVEKTFDLKVEDAPSPMSITLASGPISAVDNGQSAAVEVREDTPAGFININTGYSPGDNFSYGHKVDIKCDSCKPASLVSISGLDRAMGPGTFKMNIQPTFTSGDDQSGPGGTSLGLIDQMTHKVVITVTGIDAYGSPDPTRISTKTVYLTVKNVNRPPSAISLKFTPGGGGIEALFPDQDAMILDAAKPGMKTVELNLIDPDNFESANDEGQKNDVPVFIFTGIAAGTEAPQFGNIIPAKYTTDAVKWTMDPGASCVLSPGGTVTRKVAISGTDQRSGVAINRLFTIRILNARGDCRQ
ncbi:MAG: hypothetical protein H7222_15885 [Methylotenera sp.]|nr:hypothetical protein [Oligoflexia bacterium]